MNKNTRDSLGDRMKRYEAVPKNSLMHRQPAILRLDGKAFHTFTRGFQKPFDAVLMRSMQETMKYLCENIQGCVIGYTQSDEITLILCDYQKLESESWFDYQVEKMTSVSASMATLKFNRIFAELAEQNPSPSYQKALGRGALFDARVFTVPIAEVNNCLVWRQQDAVRNSIEALAQSLYSARQLHGLNCKIMQEKMLAEKGICWNDLPAAQKRGSCCIKKTFQLENCIRSKWVIDEDIPVFSEHPEYVNSRITFDESA